ncbi:MAG: CYTH domain-containing protein [Bacteroidota bacterium]
MGHFEIERKFLVTSVDYRSTAISKTKIVQGFLNTDPKRTVRVRIKGDKAFLTVKGIGNALGTTRFEWEIEIDITEANDLMGLCGPIILEKIRFNVPAGKHVFEVDEFLGENKGLTIAEIELGDEDEIFEKPSWIGDEVTGNIRYYNSQLIKRPYHTWKN